MPNTVTSGIMFQTTTKSVLVVFILTLHLLPISATNYGDDASYDYDDYYIDESYYAARRPRTAVTTNSSSANTISPVRFAMHCHRLVSARIDPDRFLGECSTHVHDAFGAATWNPEVEKKHLANRFRDDDSGNQSQKTQTTCAHPKDRSMYWNPSLYLRAPDCSSGQQPGDNGCGIVHLAKPSKMTVYYMDFAASKKTPIIRERDRLAPFPKNFRIRVDPADGPVAVSHFWTCKGHKDPNSLKLTTTFRIPAGYKRRASWRSFIGEAGARHCDTLMLRIPFPGCFKSKRASVDSGIFTGRDGLCPVGYPIRFPQLQYNVEWNLTEAFQGRHYQCGSWDDCMRRIISGGNDNTGEMMHAVFINGWSKNLLRQSMENCTFRPGAASGPACPLEDVLGADSIRTGGNWLGKDQKPQLPGRLPIEDVEAFRRDLLSIGMDKDSMCNIPYWSS